MEYEVIHNFLEKYTVELSALGIVLGIVPLIKNLIMYFSPQISYVDVGVIDSYIPHDMSKDVFISYKGKKTTCLKVQFVTIFNNKSKALLKEDLRNEPFCIYVENGFLDVELINQLKNEGNIKLKKINDQKYFIEFNYMNPNDAITLKVIYSQKEPIISLKAANLNKFERRVNLLTDKYSRFSLHFEFYMLLLYVFATNQLSTFKEFNKFSFPLISSWNTNDVAMILQYIQYICAFLWGISICSIIVYTKLKGAPHWVWKFFKKSLKKSHLPLIQISKYHDDFNSQQCLHNVKKN